MQVKSSQQQAQGRHRGFQIETFGPCIEVAYNVAMEEFVDGHKMSLVPDSDSRAHRLRRLARSLGRCTERAN